MNKETPVTFEEMFRLLKDRDRFIAQKEEAVSKLQQLTTEVDKTKLQLKTHVENISAVECKIRALGVELGKV